MALAGTQAAKPNSDETYFWQQKDRDEQRYVTDYVIETLNDLEVKKLKGIGDKNTASRKTRPSCESYQF